MGTTDPRRQSGHSGACTVSSPSGSSPSRHCHAKMAIVGICEQAAKTFARMANSASRVLQPVEFEEHLSKLIEMLSVTMEPSDLGLHRSKVMNAYSSKRHVDPSRHLTSATYIDLFIVHPGKSLPLHDHPGMHGILKCVAGGFHITSYSAFADSDNIPLPPSLANYEGRVQPIPTKATVSNLSPSSPPLVLTPDDDNFHEIRAMDFECSAFLDILSPPYHESEDEVRPGENVRNCTYFRVALREKYEGDDVNWLVEASEEEKRRFFTRSEPYLGPRIGQANANEEK